MTIVVAGYIVGYPLGGMTWHHLNYLLGLYEMGHEVWFLEDSGDYLVPYNPQKKLCDLDSAFGRAYLEKTFRDVGLPVRYCYYSEFEDRYFGLSESELHDLLTRADLMICVSGITPMRESRPRPRRALVIDTDPVFTQIRMTYDANFLSYYRKFDACATFGRLIGTPDCSLPTQGIQWIPTNQPIALSHWPASDVQSREFTTIGKWEQSAERHIEFAGKQYLSNKSVEWERLAELPQRTTWRLKLAMQSMPRAKVEQFEARGWTIVDGETASDSCQSFRGFVQQSAGEFTVAKQIYAQLPSGWFSDRSAAYLASGKPVVTQNSGFDRWLPTGTGLFSFQSVDEAAAALEIIAGDYRKHAAKARVIAENYFDSRKVLTQLLERAL